MADTPDVEPLRVAYAVEDPEQLPRVVEAAEAVLAHVSRYAAWLQRFDAGMQLPRAIVFVDLGAATRVLSRLPLPAWTSVANGVVYADPIPADWAATFTGAIPADIEPEIVRRASDHYATLGPADVASIVGHELTHHLTAFDPDAASTDWFEEGYCFYLSRSRVLDTERLREVSEAEAMLLAATVTAPGHRAGGLFGVAASSRIDEVLVDYWCAIQTVTTLAQAAGDDGRALLDQYRAWRARPGGTTFLGEATAWGVGG